jgi:protein-disulfide isomerase
MRNVPVVILMLTVACASDTRVRRLEARVDSLVTTVTALVNRQQGGSEGLPSLTDTVTVTAEGVARGAADAPVVMVEFTDYQCPYCARHARETVPQLHQPYVATGRVRYLVRAFPLTAIHPHAQAAAEAARCVALQDTAAFWRYHDALFARQREIAPDLLRRLGAELGLDTARFAQCVNTRQTRALVERDLAAAEGAQFTSTPTIVVGRPTGTGEVTGVLIRGAYPVALFRQAIDSALRVTARSRR